MLAAGFLIFDSVMNLSFRCEGSQYTICDSASFEQGLIVVCTRVCHLQFFWISLLFQAGTSVCHTQEQKKYRCSMFYVGIFQLFLTFVLYKHKLVAKKSGFLLNWSKIVQQYDRSDVVTQ